MLFAEDDEKREGEEFDDDGDELFLATKKVLLRKCSSTQVCDAQKNFRKNSQNTLRIEGLVYPQDDTE